MAAPRRRTARGGPLALTRGGAQGLAKYIYIGAKLYGVGSLIVSTCREQVPSLSKRDLKCEFKFGLTEVEVTVTDPLGAKKTHKLSFNI